MGDQNQVGFTGSAGEKPKRKKRQSPEYVYTHAFPKAIPGEVMVCLERCLKASGIPYEERPKVKETMFGTIDIPFARHQVQINGEEISIPWGRFSVEGLGMLDVDVNSRHQFQLTCLMEKNMPVTHFNALVHAIEGELQKESSRIFRGNAIKIERPEDLIIPNLLDVTRNLPYILNRDVEEALETSLFLPIEHRDVLRGQVRLKRGIIMEGSYGVGKSLTAYITAQKAIRHGWTYLTVRAGMVTGVLGIAGLLQPCVLFVEDLDEVAHGGRDGLNALLNTLSGVESKSAPEIIFLVSTNFIKRLDRAFLRPERIDAIVTMSPPNRETVGRLIHQYAGGLLDDSSTTEEWDKVNVYLEGATPAIIGEAVERAKIKALATGTKISAVQLMGYANQMRRQRELAEPEFNDATNSTKLAEALYKTCNGMYSS